MLIAVLDLNQTVFSCYHLAELELNWRNTPAIRIWLKVRQFDLSEPINVSKNEEKNTLTFSQTKPILSKTVMIVHPNPKILEQLTTSVKEQGHNVLPFIKVKDATAQLKLMFENKHKLDKIVVPKNLKVYHNFTYEKYLNKKFPSYGVITVDNREYRETIKL